MRSVLSPEIPVSTTSSGLMVVTIAFRKSRTSTSRHGIVHVPTLRVRHSGVGLLYSGCKTSPCGDVLYDAMLFFERVKLAFDTPK